MARRRKWVIVSLLLLLSAGAALQQSGRLAVWLGREWTIPAEAGAIEVKAGMSLDEVAKRLAGDYSVHYSIRSDKDQKWLSVWSAGEAWMFRFVDGKLVDVKHSVNSWED